jgi:hypothetical protein
MKRVRMTHQFVEFMPAEPHDGVLYVSVLYCTVVHRCACGCGHKVVTPIGPADWQLGFDGDGITLNPSIGNWAFPCRSHYWVTSNAIRWAPPWTDSQISRGRDRDNRTREKYFAERDEHGPRNFIACADEDGARFGWCRWWRRMSRR